MELFQSLLDNRQCLEVITLGNNHFKKEMISKDIKKEIETFHLGLYRTFGGRFTLVQDGSDHYLVFCGVPKQEAFKETPLLKAYTTMQSRTGVLSRDWCLARGKLSEREFTILKELFSKDDKKQIEHFILQNKLLLENLMYYGTFIIDNPVKKEQKNLLPNVGKYQFQFL